MSITAASARAWLTTYARELEGGVETLRAAAVLRSGKGVDISAEALGTCFALLCVYRDAPGASISSVTLESIRAVSLLTELLASSINNKLLQPPWRVLTLLECTKAAIRLYRVYLSKGMSLREAEKLPRPILPPKCTCGVAHNAPQECEKVRAHLGARSGRLILSNNNNNNNNNVSSSDSLFTVAWERQKTASFGGSPNSCLRCKPQRRAPVPVPSTTPPVSVSPVSPVLLASPAEHVAEFLHILRPCVQLVMLKTLGIKSWSAWGASMAIDTVSMALAKEPKNSNEEEELRRRHFQMLLYLVRSPLFDYVLKFILRKIERVLRRIPLVGAPISASFELMLVLQKLWFYTAGS